MKYDILYWSKRATEAVKLAKIAGKERRATATLEYLAEADMCIGKMHELHNPKPWYKKIFNFRKNK